MIAQSAGKQSVHTSLKRSDVVVGLIEPDIVLCVDHVVARVDVVALQHLLEDLWLVHGAFLHEVDDLVLNHH